MKELYYDARPARSRDDYTMSYPRRRRS